MSLFDIFSPSAIVFMVFIFVIGFSIPLIQVVTKKGWKISARVENYKASRVRTKNNKKKSYVMRTKNAVKVVHNSEPIQEIIKLNNSYYFAVVNPCHTLSWACNNKRQFDNAIVSEWFKAEIEDSPHRFREIVSSIENNKNNFYEYIKKINGMKSTITEEICADLRISLKRFKKIEKKIFNKLIFLQPVCDMAIYCEKSYRTPKGRNYYYDWKRFSFYQLKEYVNEVEQLINYKKTKQYFVQTERSKMSPKLRYNILERDRHCCQICGRSPKDGVVLEVDHIIPVSKGGKTEESNLRTLCRDCNRGKGAET